MVKKRVRGGLSFFFFVLIVGLILAAFNIAAGIGFSLRIPVVDQNLMAGVAIGKKEAVLDTFPGYLRRNLAQNNTFFNQSNTITIWLAEGAYIIIFGQQPNAPLADLQAKLLR